MEDLMKVCNHVGKNYYSWILLSLIIKGVGRRRESKRKD